MPHAQKFSSCFARCGYSFGFLIHHRQHRWFIYLFHFIPLQVLNIPSWTIKANRFHFLCFGTDKVLWRVVLGWKLRPNDLRVTQDCIRIAACRDAEQRQSSQGRRHVLLLIQFWCRWPKHGYAKSTRNVVSHQITAKEFSNIPWISLVQWVPIL